MRERIWKKQEELFTCRSRRSSCESWRDPEEMRINKIMKDKFSSFTISNFFTISLHQQWYLRFLQQCGVWAFIIELDWPIHLDNDGMMIFSLGILSSAAPILIFVVRHTKIGGGNFGFQQNPEKILKIQYFGKFWVRIVKDWRRKMNAGSLLILKVYLKPT
jgi:hypothetical protein